MNLKNIFKFLLKNKVRHIPLFLTALRIPLSIIFIIAITILQLTPITILFCLFILLLLEASDLFDGIISRRYNLTSQFGEIFDSYSDSISRIIVYSALMFKELTIIAVPIVMALRDITVAYIRIISSIHGKYIPSKVSGKIKGIVQALGAFSLLSGPMYWNFIGIQPIKSISYVVIIVTILSMFEYFNELKLLLKNSNL